MGNQREKVLQTRYFKDGEKSDTDLFRRVSKALADNPQQEIDFFNVMKTNKFLPNTPCLVNAGDPNSSGQLFACFVLPIEDSMDSIFTTLHDTAMIHKTGGGTGFNFGRLRPQNSKVKSTNGVASGAISFMTAYDAATETVKQGGVRRGANMGVFPITHPDVLEFIRCKDDTTKLNNFNISIAITDNFIEAVKNNTDWQFTFNGIQSEHEPIKARKLMDMIVEQAWKNGEPGVLFIDRINEKHSLNELIEATNPCGEQPLLPYESCCLGSVNLSKFVDDEKSFDYEDFKQTINIAVSMLNNMIDENTYPLKQIEEKCLVNRKIGLGVMGYADMLIKMGLKYGSDEALKATEDIAKAYQRFSEMASNKLAEKDGCFESWKDSAWYKNTDHEIPNPMRNATVTTIAPTGSISIIAECSSGIEPIFSPVTVINRVDATFVEIHPLVEDELKKHGLYEKFISDKMPLLKNYLPELDAMIVTAHDVTPEQHVRTQSIWQKYTHNAVSKTINMPNSAKREDVFNVYMMAYDLGCKGITVYRDGSRYSQVLSTQKTDDNNEQSKQNELDSIVPISKDELGETYGTNVKRKVACGNLYINVCRDKNGNLIEIFINTGKGGICQSNTNAISRLISASLRSGVKVDEIIDQLKGILCPACTRVATKGEQLSGMSCADVIAKVLIDEYNKDEIIIKKTKNGKGKRKTIKQTDKSITNKCPECNGELKSEGGCLVCIECAWSKCS